MPEFSIQDMSVFEAFLFFVTMIGARYFIFAAGAFFIFYVLLKRPLWFLKIQKRMPTVTDYGRDIMYSLMSILIFGIVASVTVFLLSDYNNIHYGPIAEYGLFWFAASLVWMILLHDAYFYWMHRLMHTKTLYKHVHLVHHRSSNPSPWTAYAFHPLEALLEAGIIVVIAFTLPVHIFALAIFFLFQIVYNVYGHLGFELYPEGFHKTAVGRWINTSVAHNQHHGRFTGNYGLYLLFWDRVMGTIREDYDETFERSTSGKQSTPHPQSS